MPTDANTLANRTTGQPPPADTRVADSMKAAAGLTGLTEARIAAAKAAGCPAFRGSRIHIGELLAWLEQNGDTLPTGDAELDEITKEIAREKLRAHRFNNDVAEGRYVLREDFAAQLLALGLELKVTLRRKLEEEFPDQQTMRTRDEILGINRRLTDELCRLFQEGTEKWSRK